MPSHMCHRLSVSLVVVLLWMLVGKSGQCLGGSVTDESRRVDREAAWQMSRRIDHLLEEPMAAAGQSPKPLCSDSEFLRRASLDLTGVIPAVADVQAFLADTRSDKRSRWIERLLVSPRHATHLAITWRRLMLPTDFDANQLGQAAGLQQWLRRQFVNNLRYDRLVAEFISSNGDQATGPALFYRSLETNPAKLAAATSRIFLGLQIQCAECHDHPFDAWTQRDFWGYAAFFAQLEPITSMRGGPYRLVDLSEGEVTLPETDDVVAPHYPAGPISEVDHRGTRRRQLAIWMASADNPYLAPAAVNRVWQQMFGRGLVRPVDDLGPSHPPSHPELFAELADFFVKQQFDLRQLYRTFANTNAYQRTSLMTSDSSRDSADDGSSDHSYARMVVKRLTAEQLYDSLHRSLRLAYGDPGPADAARRDFVAQMDSPSRDLTDYDLGFTAGAADDKWLAVCRGRGGRGSRDPGGSAGTVSERQPSDRTVVPCDGISDADECRTRCVQRPCARQFLTDLGLRRCALGVAQ